MPRSSGEKIEKKLAGNNMVSFLQAFLHRIIRIQGVACKGMGEE